MIGLHTFHPVLAGQTRPDTAEESRDEAEAVAFLIPFENLIPFNRKEGQAPSSKTETDIKGKQTKYMKPLNEMMEHIKELPSQLNDLMKLFAHLKRLNLPFGGAVTSLSFTDHVSVDEIQFGPGLQKLFEHMMQQATEVETNQNAVSHQQKKGISEKDITNLLHQVLRDQKEFLERDPDDVKVNIVRRMSLIEQHSIYMSRSQQREDRLMEQFYKVLREIPFQQNRLDLKGFTLKLNPDQLGTITVRFTHIKGEVFIKMVASTQMAQELLETNLHQLRHVFAPHQVLIELEDVSLEEELPDESDQQNQEKESEHEDEQEENHWNKAQINRKQTMHFPQLVDEQKRKEII